MTIIKDTVQKVREMIGSRSYAYRSLFRAEDKWAKIVLLDLAKYCRAHQSTFDADPRKHAVMEGRREVFLRIQQHIHLTDEQLIDLHSIKYIPKEK